ncbi:MAG: TetR/AcrR family transcriptional regulator [Vulcanimicrobiaceae bacterium]
MTSVEILSAPETAYSRKTRARILTAAEKHFRHYGFAKTTIVDIANDCAMSHANVYRFFRNKTEIVDAIAATWLAKSERVCAEVAARPGTASVRLMDFVIELHRWKHREHLRGSRTHELLTLASYNGRPFVVSHLGVLAGLLTQIIEDGNRSGEFAVTEPHRLARTIQDATMKFCDPRLVEQYRDEPLEEQAREVMRVIISGIMR